MNISKYCIFCSPSQRLTEWVNRFNQYEELKQQLTARVNNANRCDGEEQIENLKKSIKSQLIFTIIVLWLLLLLTVFFIVINTITYCVFLLWSGRVNKQVVEAITAAMDICNSNILQMSCRPLRWEFEKEKTGKGKRERNVW